MSRIIKFNNKGYDGFIDFIKAYAIIAVLVGHTFPNLDRVAYFTWLGMQVPLFVLVQAFHVFKKENPKVSLSKIFHRVLFPFFAIEIITFILAAFFFESGCKSLIISMLIGVGMVQVLITLGYIYSVQYSYLYLQKDSIAAQREFH